MKNIKLNRKGFSAIELLITITIIAIMAVIAFNFINPQLQLSRLNNNKRLADVNALITAVGRRIADNKGKFETNCAAGAIPTLPTNMGRAAGKYNIEPCLVPVYLTQMPYDPVSGTLADTKYQISQNSNGKITISASQAELGKTISVTR